MVGCVCGGGEFDRGSDAGIGGCTSGVMMVVVPSGFVCIRCAFLDCLRVGLSVHFRFLAAQREQGNFLSHFVFVFAQLLHAIGVRPADLGNNV